jgi:hypothetical protein
MGIGTDTYANWERGKTEPVAAQFQPVVEFHCRKPSFHGVFLIPCYSWQRRGDAPKPTIARYQRHRVSDRLIGQIGQPGWSRLPTCSWVEHQYPFQAGPR